MSRRSEEVAKFFCGFEVFHGVFHAYLWLSGTTFTAFGVTATRTWNLVGAVVNGLIALVPWSLWVAAERSHIRLRTGAHSCLAAFAQSTAYRLAS